MIVARIALALLETSSAHGSAVVTAEFRQSARLTGGEQAIPPFSGHDKVDIDGQPMGGKFQD
jgi:hypothetical protein